jgi:energy-coupling factor transport system permease protein
MKRYVPNPLALLVAQVSLMVPVLLAIDPYTPLLFFAVGLVNAVVVGKLRLGKLLKILVPLSTVSLSLFFMNLLFPAQGINGLARGIAVFLRSFSLITLSTAYITMVSPYDVIRALMQNWNLPYRIGYALFAGWNTIPLIRRDIELIQKAQAIRKAGSVGRKIPLSRLPITLLAGVILHGERLSLSMAARGLDTCGKRSFIVLVPWKRSDTVYDALMILVAAFLWITLIHFQVFTFELG